MKFENSIRLANLASRNVFDGGASALVIAKRAAAITGSEEALEIVNRVYCHPRGRATWDCRECGSVHLTPEDSFECCNENFSEED